MAKLLLNADGKVLMSNDKVLKAPESALKTLLDATKSCSYLFSGYTGTSVDDLISYNDIIATPGLRPVEVLITGYSFIEGFSNPVGYWEQ